MALQYANRKGLTAIPIRESRFYGTATNVQDYKDYTQKYDKDFTVKAATHYTDFVSRTPLVGLRSKYIVGGNKPTGGVEDRWFLYSHSSYFAEKPQKYLKDNQGKWIDENGNRVDKPVKNPYLKHFNERWTYGVNHNQVSGDNPSLPVVVEPSNNKDK